VEQNFHDESLNLARTAVQVKMNPDYLGKLFKKEVNATFNEYLNRFRIEKSKHLLSTTDKKITDIAFEVGYSSLENFNRIFKKYEKVTPSDYHIRNFKQKT
jgi:two-component system response regulator YesN